MIRSSLFTLLCLLTLGFAVSSCDGNEVDLTNSQIDPPIIEVEDGTLNYTKNGTAVLDIGLGFVCRTDSISPGIFAHSYTVTNVDLSGISDTNFIAPIAEGDVVIGGYTGDVNDIEGTYLYMMVETAVGELELARCFDCPVTMVEDDGTLTGTFSGTLLTTNPDSVFVITEGTFDVPLIELDCN
jgi:hypothetical protein